ncbi:hypothetical protein PC118_g9583 [Phytophthora cactorum]|uniref:Uncharacterized protein n=2 Tax=Phytophthora cactorum TaxID=29920 RepID=A0A8T0Z6E5_9STRA|nr:hypothetical protein PC112_g10001 [Phytophthora cactorum]KAG2857835.1 hypothetical protein PC113_g10348 [Phytophthora cactorum]KAG2983142.1 hypothetical protein PC118_g9583 [Phytophthora cactorum]KAG3020199.1 hypothetical protein PC119_g10064 [Phytophthora cactorum]KAG3020685.1 hypothetical protein PC120_g9145 [Phytophthora cactorum]
MMMMNSILRALNSMCRWHQAIDSTALCTTLSASLTKCRRQQNRCKANSSRQSWVNVEANKLRQGHTLIACPEQPKGHEDGGE